MTTLTNAQRGWLRKWSAIEVMGWHYEEKFFVQGFCTRTYRDVWVSRDEGIIRVADWNPLANLDQAVMVGKLLLQRRNGLALHLRITAAGFSDAALTIGPGNQYEAESDELATALLVACARASGVEEI